MNAIIYQRIIPRGHHSIKLLLPVWFDGNPEAKNNDEKLIYVYIGNIIYEMTQKELPEQQNSKAEINIRETELFVPFDYKIDNYETVSQVLIFDTARNSQILKDIDENISRFKSILILTKRKSHVNILNLYLKEKYETIAISEMIRREVVKVN